MFARIHSSSITSLQNAISLSAASDVLLTVRKNPFSFSSTLSSFSRFKVLAHEDEGIIVEELLANYTKFQLF
ncbi:hypothetical protein QL285_029297 [Trifolium repens]|nr:hypothetical protein QL285_029297 [Trifolium repens]